MTAPTSARDLLRHPLATLAYRAGKALADAPTGFESFSVAPGSRTPGQILTQRGESYFRSDIEIGRVGKGQAAPRREFD